MTANTVALPDNLSMVTVGHFGDLPTVADDVINAFAMGVMS